MVEKLVDEFINWAKNEFGDDVYNELVTIDYNNISFFMERDLSWNDMEKLIELSLIKL